MTYNFEKDREELENKEIDEFFLAYLKTLPKWKNVYLKLSLSSKKDIT